MYKFIVFASVSLSALVYAGAGVDQIFQHGFEDPIIWDGGGDGTLWSDPLNWNGDKIPVDGNAVVINDPGTITVVYDGSLGTTQLVSLVSTESLTLTGGHLQIINFSWTGNTLTVDAPGSMTVPGAFVQSAGTVTGSGLLTVAGLFTWTAGFQSGSGETVADGGIALMSLSDNNLDTRTLTLNAPSTHDADLKLRNGAVINNYSSFDIQNDQPIVHSGGAISTFNNFGTVMKSVSAGGASIYAHFFNSGTVQVNTGTLKLGNSGTSASSEGSFEIAALATLNLGGTHTMLPASSFSGAGGVSVVDASSVVEIQGGFLFNGPVALLGGTLSFEVGNVAMGELKVSGGTLMSTSDLMVNGTMLQSAGTVTGSGLLTVAGLFTWTAGFQSGSGETVADGGIALMSLADNNLDTRTLTLNAPSTHNGDLRLRNGAVINNYSSFDIQNDQPIVHSGGINPTFNNHGSISKSAAAGETQIRADFNNFGAVGVDSGSILFAKTFVQNVTGTLEVGISASLTFNSYPVTGSASLDGNLDINLLQGFEPGIGEMFEIMNFASGVGTFATINGMDIGNGSHFEITYGPTSVTLEVVADL